MELLLWRRWPGGAASAPWVVAVKRKGSPRASLRVAAFAASIGLYGPSQLSFTLSIFSWAKCEYEYYLEHN